MKLVKGIKKSVMVAAVLGFAATAVGAGAVSAADTTTAPISMKPAADGTYSREQLEYLAKLIQDRFNKNLPAINKQINDQLQKNNAEAAQKALGNREIPIVLTNKANLPASYSKEHIKANFTDVSKFVQNTGFVNKSLRMYVEPVSVDDGLLILTSYGFLDNKDNKAFSRYLAYDLNTDKMYYAKYRVNYNTKTLKTSNVETFDYVDVMDSPQLHDTMKRLAASIGYTK